MTIIRSTAYIGRHGEAPKDEAGRSLDKLKPGQPHVLYGHTGMGIIKPLIDEMGLEPKQIEYGASSRVRAVHSNMAILAGTLGLPVPITLVDIDYTKLQGKPSRFITENELDYLDFKYNPEMMKNNGYPRYATFWFNGPQDLAEAEGVKITSPREFIRAREEYLRRLVSKLGKEARLIVHTTHSPCIEAIALAALNASRGYKSPAKLKEIGGLFSAGGTNDGHLFINVERHDKSGSISEVTMRRGENKFLVSRSQTEGMRL